MGNQTFGLSWGIETGQMLYYLIDFVWMEDGSWMYQRFSDEDVSALCIEVPQVNEGSAPIKLLQVNEAQKTLGLMTCPSGSLESALKQMKE